MTIDVHCHVGNFSPLFEGDHGVDDLVAAQDRAGVGVGMLSILIGDDPRRANTLTEQACARYPGRLYGDIFLNPTDLQGALAELERCARMDCFRGVKLHPSDNAWFPFMEEYFPLYERIEQLSLPILIHSGTSPYSHPLQIAYAARLFPGVPFILAHFGLADLSWECFPAAALADNVHVDTTANPMVRVMSEWQERFGARRMLWGSDFPFYEPSYELAKIDALTCSAADRERIRHGNAVELYGLQ